MDQKKQRHLTKREQERLERFHVELEIQTDKAVVLGEFIGYNKVVDFSRAGNHLFEDEENEVPEDNDGADDNHPVVNNTT